MAPGSGFSLRGYGIRMMAVIELICLERGTLFNWDLESGLPA